MSQSGQILSDSEDLEENDTGKMEKFVQVIVKHQVLFDKSHLPDTISRKNKAIEDSIKELESIHAQKYNKLAFMKKVSRIKNEVKIKADKQKTGNKRIALKNWEKSILEIISSNHNPTMCQVPGAVEAGIGQTSNSVQVFARQNEPSESGESSRIPPRPLKRKSSVLEEAETEETRSLSTGDLQRLVLIEQLNLIRLKKDRLIEKF